MLDGRGLPGGPAHRRKRSRIIGDLLSGFLPDIPRWVVVGVAAGDLMSICARVAAAMRTDEYMDLRVQHYLVVSDLRVLFTGRSVRNGALAVRPTPWSSLTLGCALPRSDVVAAARTRRGFNTARLRLEFADGSWLLLGPSLGDRGGKVDRLATALRSTWSARPTRVGLREWNEYGGEMLHLFEPGERVLAFEDIAVIDGRGVPAPLGPPRSEEPLPLVWAIVAVSLAVTSWSPHVTVHHGRTGYGTPQSLFRGCGARRPVVQDRRHRPQGVVIGDPRGMSALAVVTRPDRWELRFAATRDAIAAAKRQWYWLHWARLRLDFADGSWLKCVTSVGGGRGKVERVLAAMRPDAVGHPSQPAPQPT